MTTLSYTDNAIPPVTTTVTLPDDLFWSDEFNWSPVVYSMDQTLSGALIVETAIRQAGRPITLQGQDDFAWITRSVLATLQVLASIEGAVMTLELPGRAAMDVIFRHEQTAIQATPIQHQEAPDPGDWYFVTLSLMEI